MKFNHTLLNLIVATVTLSLGLMFFGVWQFTENLLVQKLSTEQVDLKAKNIPTVKTEEKLPEVIAKPSSSEITQDAKIEKENKPQIKLNGFYGFFSNPDPNNFDKPVRPKGFKDFEHFEIWTTDYLDATKKDFQFPLKGFFQTKHLFELNKLTIVNDKISFSTNRIKGISYEFSGKYDFEKTSHVFEGKEYVQDNRFIKGFLVKKRNGKIIAEAKVKLNYDAGC